MHRLVRLDKHQERLEVQREPEAAAARESAGTFFVLRESSACDFALLDDLMHKVMDRHVAEFPQLEQVLAHGANFVRVGPEFDALRRTYSAEPLYGLSSRKAARRPVAYALQRGDVRVILALSSAGAVESMAEATNAWTSVLADQVKLFRPAKLYTGSFSRLVRNADLASRLKLALEATRTEVECFEYSAGFNLSEQLGQMVWSLLVQTAHTDWVATITRLQLGRVYSYSRNTLPAAEVLMPVGYRRAEKAPHSPVIPDPEQRDVVRAIIELAASGASDDECIERLQTLGLRRRGHGSHGGIGADLASVADRATFMRTLWANLEVYREGHYETLVKNSVPGCDQMLGHRVYRDRPEDLGEFHFVLELGVPEGGWHDADLIDLAIETRLTRRARRSTRSKAVKPLLGLGNYTLGGREYRLLSDDRDYQLRSRPEESARLSFNAYEGVLEGRFRAADLHAAVAAALRQMAQLAATDEPMTEAVDPLVVAGLRKELADLEARADSGRELAARMHSEDKAESERYMRDAAELGRRATTVQAEIERMLRGSSLQVGECVEVDQSRLIAVAELLERTKLEADPEVVIAIRSALQSVRILTSRGQVSATAEVRARVLVGRVTRVLGPGRVTLANRVKMSTAGAPTVNADANLAYLHEWLHAADKEEVRNRQGFTPAICSRRRREAAAVLFEDRRIGPVVVDSPLPELHAVVLNPLFESRGLKPLPMPEHLDASWIREMPRVYRSEEWRWLHATWARRDLTKQRQLLTWMQDYLQPGQALSFAQAREATGLSEPSLYGLLTPNPGSSPG